MPSEASAKEGRRVPRGLLFYVDLIESDAQRGQRYVGMTSDLRARLKAHNAGRSPHTAKYAPWRVVTYLAFSDQSQALAFEAYLKSGSGHAFVRKRLR